MIKILNKNGKILKVVDADNLSDTDLSGADLSDINLRGADLLITITSRPRSA